MKNMSLVLATVFTIVSGGAAFAADTAAEFAQKAATGSQFEILASQVALQKSKNTEVKTFAQHMIDDHSKASDALKDALSKAKITMPSKALDEDHQDKLDDLNAASADDFDEAYIDSQVEAHKQTIDLFKEYSEDGDNQELKAFAAKTLPTLEMHKESIDVLDTKQ